jgi:prevent-host-death family protein
VGIIGIRELKARASEVIARSERGERFLVTKRGRPVSILLPVDASEFEDFILANSPELVRLVRRAERDLALGRTVSWDVLKRQRSRQSPRRARRAQ